MDLVCPVCDLDLFFNSDWAAISWFFVPAGRTLLSYFTYGDIEVTSDSLYSGVQSSLEGTLFLAADGTFSNAVFKALTRSLEASQLEMVYHCTNSRSHCVLGVRCLGCGYCCSLAFSKHNREAWPKLRSSLARWLGVQEQDVAGSACYVSGMHQVFRDAVVRNAVGVPGGV